MKIPVNGAELYCEALGDGPPVVVLHGGPEFDQTYLRPWLDSLATDFRVVYYDQRGRGRSSGDAEDLSYDSEVADLDALRLALGCDRISLIGHSHGSLIALSYAIRFPDHVERMVLMNSAPACAAGFDDVRALRRKKLGEARIRELKDLASSPAFLDCEVKTFAEYCQVLLSVGVHRSTDFARLDFSLSHYTDETVRRAMRISDRLSAEIAGQQDWDICPLLAKVEASTLVIHGESDFVPAHCARQIAESLPGATLTVLADCGHFAFVEHPEAVLALITSHLRGGAWVHALW